MPTLFIGNIVEMSINCDAKSIEIKRKPLFRGTVNHKYGSNNIRGVCRDTYKNQITVKVNPFRSIIFEQSSVDGSMDATAPVNAVTSIFIYTDPIRMYSSEGSGRG